LEDQGDKEDEDDASDSLHHLINASSMSLIASEDLAFIAQAPVVLNSSMTSSSFGHDNKKCVIQVYSGKVAHPLVHDFILVLTISLRKISKKTGLQRVLALKGYNQRYFSPNIGAEVRPENYYH
jgi:hypothetical protein